MDSAMVKIYSLRKMIGNHTKDTCATWLALQKYAGLTAMLQNGG
jgi:hypothetical protein